MVQVGLCLSLNLQICFCSRGFIDDNPDGTLTKEKMMDMYSAVLSVKKAGIFVEQIFSKFDTDNNGSIDFKVSFNFGNEVTW